MSKGQRLTIAAVFTGVIILTAWISIPAPIPFTLQALGIYLCCGVLGGKVATLSTIAYVALGAVGLPVLSGFQGGLGAIFGATGGFIMGFVLIPLSVWLFEKTPLKKRSLIVGGAVGTTLCNILGMVWYSLVYTKGTAGLVAAFTICVLPYIIPDAVKLIVAHLISKKMNKLIKTKAMR